jgi:hypothetical protein
MLRRSRTARHRRGANPYSPPSARALGYRAIVSYYGATTIEFHILLFRSSKIAGGCCFRLPQTCFDKPVFMGCFEAQLRTAGWLRTSEPEMRFAHLKTHHRFEHMRHWFDIFSKKPASMTPSSLSTYGVTHSSTSSSNFSRPRQVGELRLQCFLSHILSVSGCFAQLRRPPSIAPGTEHKRSARLLWSDALGLGRGFHFGRLLG